MKITALANALFCFNGVVCLLPGVFLIDIAHSFQVETHIIGYIYTLFTVGNVAAVQCNGRILDKINIRSQLLLVSALMLLSIIGMSMVSSLTVFACLVFTFGIGNGFFSSTASYMIVNLYADNNRSTRLNFLHCFFGIGAIVSPMLAGALLAAGFSWQSIYQMALLLLTVVAMLIWMTPVVLPKHSQRADGQQEGKFGLNVYVIAIALFCYSLSEGSFVFWGNTYFIEYLGLNITSASFLVSEFWLFMAVGRASSGLFLAKLSVEKYILINSGLAFTAGMVMLTSSTYATVLIAVGIMGFGYAGLYACILSYGTLQLPCASAKLMSLYITFGSLGGLSAPPFSSWVKQSLSLKTSLMVTGGFLGVVFILIGVTAWFLKRNTQVCYQLEEKPNP